MLTYNREKKEMDHTLTDRLNDKAKTMHAERLAEIKKTNKATKRKIHLFGRPVVMALHCSAAHAHKTTIFLIFFPFFCCLSLSFRLIRKKKIENEPVHFHQTS